MTKRQILEKIIQEQQEVIQSLEKAISLYKTTSDIDEDDTIDPEDYSHQAEAQAMQSRHEERLNGERRKLAFLESAMNKRYETISGGALIETEAYYIFLGVAVHPIQAGTKEVVCVSEEAPVAKALVGKHIGDAVTIGNQTLTITNIS